MDIKEERIIMAKKIYCLDSYQQNSKIMMKKIISVFVVCMMFCGIFTGCAKEPSTNEKNLLLG